MNLASSSNEGPNNGENPLAQLFGTFVHSEDINEPISSEGSFSDGKCSSFSQNANGLLDFTPENAEDSMQGDEGEGVGGEGQHSAESGEGGGQPGDGLDLSALAIQLLQQAQAQGILFPHKMEEKPILPPNGHFEQSKSPMGVNSASGPSPQPPPKSKSGSRRSGSKSMLSAAAAAALMAPSPLGQLPSIPGAIAVAVSPAAQLFNGDDWSWHRNPAAAIRSGGTNKQTPVWKYFVYNKAENLSRCIVGNCTYQLKGPHTSTLACHLKKHSVEYSEFQRLKSEYTRERIAAGHGQAGRLDENAEASGSSTPNGQNGAMICTQVTSPNGTIRAQSPKDLSAGFGLNPLKGGKMGNGESRSRSASLSCASSPGPPAGQIDNFVQNGNNGIFGGTNGCPLPPPAPIGGFHHFMMAAALAAAQNGQMANSRPNSLELFAPHRNGFHHPLAPPMLPPNGKGAPQMNGPPNQQGPGSNLLDILNLLSKRAANHSALAKVEKEESEEDQRGGGLKKQIEEEENEQKVDKEEREEEEEKEEFMQRRKGGGRKRTASRGEEEQPKRRPSGGGGLAAHSVEHLLGGTSAALPRAEEGEGEGAMVPLPSMNSMGDEEDGEMHRLALCLGTGLPGEELGQLLARNPFMRPFGRITMEGIEQTLRRELGILKARIEGELRQAEMASLGLMAELCCAKCWKVPMGGGEGKCSAKGCERANGQFWCTFSVTFRRSNGKRRAILLAVRKMESKNEVAEGLGKLVNALNLPSLGISHSPFLLIRPRHFSTNLQIPRIHRCLPSIFPDCLFECFFETLEMDGQMRKMLEGFEKLLRKFCANLDAQNQLKTLTGQCLEMPLDQMEMLAIGESLLGIRQQFASIWTRNFDGQEDGIEKLDWKMMAELMHIFGIIRAEIQAAGEISLGQIGERLENLQKKLRNDFSAFGDFPTKLSHKLGEIQWQMALEDDGPLPLDDIPSTPIGLAKIFGSRKSGNWAEEEAERFERAALLLHNWHLLLEGDEPQING